MRSWRNKSRVSPNQLSTGLITIPLREDTPVWDVALANDRIAFAGGTDEVLSLHLGSGIDFGPRPARLEDLQGASPFARPNAEGPRVRAPR